MRRINANEQITDLQEKNYIMVKAYNGFYYSDDSGNCKNCYISSIGNCIGDLEGAKMTSKRLDTLFDIVRKLTFSCNVTNKEYINNLSKHFELISVQEIGTGYYNTNQYHAVFFTNYKEYSQRQAYINFVNRQKLTKGEIELSYVSKFISTEQIIKLLSFKSKFWFNKYIKTLIS